MAMMTRVYRSKYKTKIKKGGWKNIFNRSAFAYDSRNKLMVDMGNSISLRLTKCSAVSEVILDALKIN